ncbi:DUF2249 domain-containing protein [Leeia oryzae]|uniref:DUF2249 domain-containing protein n=1 Tax=Leeia oryzae TaxID=356662 RepID=UPI000374EE58|nr:DUF2249 domain-containing protein [Leeia oryzae]
MSKEPIRLDVCGLMPPEPFEKAMQALNLLEKGQQLFLKIHRQPQPLYDILRDHGYSYRVETLEDGTFEIRIQHRLGE